VSRRLQAPAPGDVDAPPVFRRGLSRRHRVRMALKKRPLHGRRCSCPPTLTTSSGTLQVRRASSRGTT